VVRSPDPESNPCCHTLELLPEYLLGFDILFTSLLSFPHGCAKSGFASDFEWQLQNVIAQSISNGLP
jgi:hypothetical protein